MTFSPIGRAVAEIESGEQVAIGDFTKLTWGRKNLDRERIDVFMRRRENEAFVGSIRKAESRFRVLPYE
jgi:hypothetical protein